MRLHIFLFSIIFFLSACTENAAADIAPQPDRIVRLSDAEIRGLDPQTVSDLASTRVASDQFEGLTRFDARGQPQPGLAQSWTVSPDGLTWDFTLRPDLAFSDGSAITASLFPLLLERLNNPATGSPHGSLFSSISRIEAPSTDHVRVILGAPFPALPQLLAHPAMAALPLHRIRELGDRWTSERPLVTSGPYRVKSWLLNDHITLERNPNWHGGTAPAGQVIWRPVNDPLTAVRLFADRQVDITSGYPEDRHANLSARYGEAVHTAPYLGSYYFVFNTRKPPFDDERVRRALSMSVDRRWLSEKLSPMHNPPASGVVPSALYSSRWMPPTWMSAPIAARRALAKRLLSNAGYGDDKPLRFDIRINSSPEHRRMAVALSAMWRQIGVEASVFNSEASLHFASLRRGDFEMARSGWIADIAAPENFLVQHLSDAGPANYSGYASARFDQALRAALATADAGQREAGMQAAERILIDDAPVLPLYIYQSRALVAPRIRGWQDNPANMHPSSTLSVSTSSGAVALAR